MKTICCVACNVPLKEDDVLILDDLYMLYHRHCFKLNFSNVISVDKYKNIKEKYLFYNEHLIN